MGINVCITALGRYGITGRQCCCSGEKLCSIGGTDEEGPGCDGGEASTTPTDGCGPLDTIRADSLATDSKSARCFMTRSGRGGDDFGGA